MRGTALVTGASAGIGAAFAESYARRGYDLVLVARRGTRLKELAERLRRDYQVEARVVVADLSDPAAPDRIKAEVDAAGITIDVLVNNAGYGVPDAFLAQPWRAHRDSLEVMVIAVARLCYLFLAGMRERRIGRVINVASLAGLVPGTAGHTLYGAQKAWLIRFSESLAAEYRPHGVRVIAACPGFTYSEFHDVTGTRARVARLPRFMWQKAEKVAEHAIIAVEHDTPVAVPGVFNTLVAWLARVLPESVVRNLANRRAADYRNTGL